MVSASLTFASECTREAAGGRCPRQDRSVPFPARVRLARLFRDPASRSIIGSQHSRVRAPASDTLEGHQPMRPMPTSRRLILLLALALPLCAAANAQDTTHHQFLRGLCVGNDSALAPASYVEHPERPAALTPSSRIPVFPRSTRAGYNGRLVAAFVVDADGRVRPGSVAVISSTDPELSAWACKAVPTIAFEPGRDHGKKVASQAVMPFEYRSQLPRDTTPRRDSQPATSPRHGSPHERQRS